VLLNLKKRRAQRSHFFTSNCIAALLGSVTPEAGFKKCAAGEYFLKEANSAALQLRSPPAGEAKRFHQLEVFGDR
jgi:hypothetical protein